MEQQQASNTNITTKQATGKQFVAVVFVMALATKMFLLPIYLIQATGRDAYIALAIGGGFDLLMLGMMIAAVCLSGGKNIFELLTEVLGKVGAKIIVALFAIFMFFKLNICVSESLLFYSDNVYTDFGTEVLIFVLLFFFVAVGKHTLKALCRLNEFLIPIIIICLAILIAIVVMTGFDFENILPAVRDVEKFKYATLRHTSWLGDFSPLIMFVGRTETKKFTGAFVAAGGVIGTCVAVFFALAMSAAFGNAPYLVDTSTNLSTILQFAIGNVYGRIDMFSSVLWSLSIFIESALFFYATCRCVAFVIGKNLHLVISFCVCALLYVSQVFFMTDQTIFSVVVTSVACSVIIPVFSAVIPALTLFCVVFDKYRHKRNKDTDVNSRVEASK